MAVEIPINARVFGAINRALKAEGFNEDEAYELAKRGAELLTASETSAPSSPEKPAAGAVCKAADASGSDQPLTEFFSKPTFSRRMMLTVLATSATLIAASFLYNDHRFDQGPAKRKTCGSINSSPRPNTR